MNAISKVFFWIFTIGLGFVNPLISIGLIILYYLPGIIQDLCKSCNEPPTSKMNSFSDEIMEEMK
jgi:hypothetical protein